MTLRHRVVASLGLMGALGLCFTAAAQPGGPGDKPGPGAKPGAPPSERQEAAKDAREERKEAAKDAREERKEAAKDAREEEKEAAEEARGEKKDLKERLDDAREKVGEKMARLRGKKYPAASKDQVAKRQAKLEARLAELKKDRADRRKTSEEELKKSLGDVKDLKDQPAALRQELRHHAWRMARLEAIRRIAQDEGKTDTVSRVDKLIEKEKERHARKMENLKSTAPAGSASAAASAAHSGRALGKGGPGGPPPGRDIAGSRPEAPKAK